MNYVCVWRIGECKYYLHYSKNQKWDESTKKKPFKTIKRKRFDFICVLYSMNIFVFLSLQRERNRAIRSCLRFEIEHHDHHVSFSTCLSVFFLFNSILMQNMDGVLISKYTILLLWIREIVFHFFFWMMVMCLFFFYIFFYLFIWNREKEISLHCHTLFIAHQSFVN